MSIEALLIKQELHELVSRYCHALDRRDAQALAQVWWPEGTIDFGLFKGNAPEFIDLLCQDNPAVKTSFHSVSNTLFELDGDQAKGLCYVTAMSSSQDLATGVITDQLVGGRYLDRFARRDGQWRFIDKLFVIDWNITQPHSGVWDTGIGAAAARGCFGAKDPSHNR